MPCSDGLSVLRVLLFQMSLPNFFFCSCTSEMLDRQCVLVCGYMGVCVYGTVLYVCADVAHACFKQNTSVHASCEHLQHKDQALLFKARTGS